MALKDPINMKRLIILGSLFILALSPVFSVPSDVVYTEGETYIKDKTGDEFEADIGDIVDTGDTVTTGVDGFVELDRNGVVLKINPDTVFTLLEREENKEKTDVITLVLGSIKFRYDKITGKEPKIATGSCIAGVRGTEFSVYAGVDGSSLIVVDSGIVSVESEGETVELSAEEGVEVNPGEPPGKKFKVPAGRIDYSTWNDEKLGSMLDDPIIAVDRLKKRLDFYISNIGEYYSLFLEYSEELSKERKKSIEIAKKQGEDASKKFYNEVLFPLTIDTGNLVLNYRYYTLAALSLRRYVAGRLYLIIKTKYIINLNDIKYRDFLDSYNKLLLSFEKSIVPRLVEADI